jgi:hypothetical protein
MTASRHARPLATLALISSVACLVGSCESRNRELQAGGYRAVLDLPDGQLPFGLVVETEDDRTVLFIVNGNERLRVDDVTVADGRLRATLPGAGARSTLSAQVAGHRLEGEVNLAHQGGRRDAFPLRATLGQSWRFFETPSTDNADIAGRWVLSFVGGRGSEAASAVEFSQAFERVTATISGAADAPGLLAGEMRGDELRLSRFDGNVALLLRARIGADGALVGEYWSSSSGHRRFRAVRGPAG